MRKWRNGSEPLTQRACVINQMRAWEENEGNGLSKNMLIVDQFTDSSTSNHYTSGGSLLGQPEVRAGIHYIATSTARIIGL